MKRLHRKSDTLHSALTMASVLLCAAAILLFYVLPAPVEDETLGALLSAIIPRFFIAVFLLVIAIEFFPKSVLYRRVSLKGLLWCIPPLLVALVNFPFSALIRGTARIVRLDLLWLFLIKCFLIGLGEELLFRGIIFYSLLEYFKKKEGGLFFSVLFSSVIFALFHFVNLLDGAGILPVLQQVGYSFLTGAMFAVVYLKTKNFCIPVFLHALFDIGGFLVFDLGEGRPQDLTFWILTVVTGILCAVHIILTLVKMMRKKTSSN